MGTRKLGWRSVLQAGFQQNTGFKDRKVQKPNLFGFAEDGLYLMNLT